MRWGQDPKKWLIMKQENKWRVYPPIPSFWGRGGIFASFQEALQHHTSQVVHYHED